MLDNKDTKDKNTKEKQLKETIEQKDKKANVVIKEKDKEVDFLKKIIMVIVVIYCILLVFTLINNARKKNKIEDLQEEISCLNNQLTQTTELRDDAITLLEEVDKYVLDDYISYSESNVHIVETIRKELATLTDYEYEPVEEYEENNGLFNNLFENSMEQVKKPIIYIENPISDKIEITLSNPEKLTCSYPKYNNSWKINVSDNGTITYNDREYYGLYWEGNGSVVEDIEKGFCVKGEDTVKFLEEKLAILGLNERETNEFIIYWLPQMEKNEYNVIYFASMEEQNDYMSLNINPMPETLIRVNMLWYGTNEKVDIETQTITPVERNGYTVVEWGGTELK